MSSWKKVIVSGSDAELASLYSPSITGSLHGTASWAQNATSASYALSSSFATLSERTTQTDVLVLNQTGYTITKGMVVHITASGNSSDIPRVASASYENDNMSANTLGIATQNITNGSQGYIITEGILLGINTTNYISGQLIYLGPTGSIIGSAPLAPLHTVRLGQVVREQSSNGSIYVSINNGYELGELHDVKDTTTTSSYGDLLVKSGSVWINSKQLTGSYSITGSLIISSSGATNDFQVGDNKLFVSTSGRVGIGITTPTAKLHINNTTPSASFLVEDDTNPDLTPFIIDSTGRAGIGTITPTHILHVSGSAPELALIERNANANSHIQYKNSLGSMWAGLSPTGYFGIGSQNDLTLASFTVLSSSGNVGIGITAPTAKFHINNITTSASFLVEDDTNPDTTPFVINNIGNVGIGKLTPTSKLDVEGNTFITGSLLVTGSISLTNILTLQGIDPLPSPTNGSISFSSSGDFYFASGSAWHKLTL